MNEILRLVLIPLGVTILGSIIYGLIGRRKKDYKITCEQLSLRQYKEKESDNVKISISYKNEKVGDTLSVMIVRLTNNGKKDVAFKQVFEDKIQIILKKTDILDVQIEKQSDKVAATVEKSDSLGWLLSWGILKKKEMIVLKIVSVVNNDKGEVEVDASDLEFVFRGTNLNRIETVSSQQERAFLWTMVIVCVLLLTLVAMIPTRCSVRYDVVVEGESMKDASISYNRYTKQFLVKQSHCPIVRAKEIQSITVIKQQKISSWDIVLGSLMIAYIIFIIILYIVLKRKKNSVFSFMFRR